MTISDSFTYLDDYLAPIRPFLSRPDVTDLYINKSKEIWLEVNGREPEKHSVPELTPAILLRLARQIAASSAQGISREHPLLAAALPTGERVQIVMPPATRGEIAISIRRQVIPSLNLCDLEEQNSSEPARVSSVSDDGSQTQRIADILRKAVRERKTILISGGTSSGKTTLLNSLLTEIPGHERLIAIEDTPELNIRHENAVGLIAARSELREANVGADDLLIAALRMRPDRIILGEIRGREAVTFLRAVSTGHPGSMATIHANSSTAALDQLAFLAIQGGLKLSWDDLRKYIASTIDLSVHLARKGGTIRCSITNHPT